MMSKSRNPWIVIIGSSISASIFLLLVTSLIVTYYVTQNQLTHLHQGPVMQQGITIDIIYPEHLLHNSPPTYLSVNVTVEDMRVFTTPLTVTMLLPPSIQVSNVVSGGLAVDLVYLPENGRLQNTHLLLRNMGILQRSQPQSISPSTSLNHDLAPFEIQVEASTSAAWRQFFSTVISDNSPLILTITILVPLISILWQQNQKQQEKLQRRHAEELLIRLQKVKEQIEEVNTCLSEGRKACVQRIWLQLDHELAKHILGKYKYDQLKQLVEFALGVF